MSKETFAEILCSRAWRDDDDGTWNQEHLWVYGYDDGKTTYSTCDECGDHEPFPWDEGDTVEKYCADAERSWEIYAEDVAETGEDPLGNYLVRREVEKKERWGIRFTNWIGFEKHGYAVISGWRTDEDGSSICSPLPPEEFPQPIADYLLLKKVGHRHCMEGVTMEEIRNDASVLGNGPEYTMHLTIEYKLPRREWAVRREVKAAAKRHLAEIAKRSI